MRSLPALCALILSMQSTMASAEEDPGLACGVVSHIVCEAGGLCRESIVAPVEVTLWPDSTPNTLCRALHCPPLAPSIAIYGPLFWSGSVQYAYEAEPRLGQLRKGMAYVVPAPQPRHHASMHFALAFDPESGRLSLSRFDAQGLQTTWFHCQAPHELEEGG